MNCAFYSVCATSESQKATCVCPLCIDSEISPVCGDNGVTYSNECYMKKYACEERRMITIAKEQSCGIHIFFRAITFCKTIQFRIHFLFLLPLFSF